LKNERQTQHIIQPKQRDEKMKKKRYKNKLLAISLMMCFVMTASTGYISADRCTVEHAEISQQTTPALPLQPSIT